MSRSAMPPVIETIGDARAAAVLERLHLADEREGLATVFALWRHVPAFLMRRRLPWDRLAPKLGSRFMAVDRTQGLFLYLTARSLGARQVVEFGTSYGVSTIYLALAVAHNGGGRVIGTELLAEKAERARQYLAEAGLAEFVEIRVGDARDTLRDLPGPIDMLLNDGFPPAALPVLRTVEPALRRGAVIVSDNVGLFPADLRSYIDYLRDPAHGYGSMRLPLNEGTEWSVRLR